MSGERTGRRSLSSRVVYGSFLGLATAFIVSSTYQIIVALFGLQVAPLASPANDSACAAAIERLVGALDRASRAAHGEDEAAFASALAPEWDAQADTERICRAEPRGTDAYGALLRLRRAEEGSIRRQSVEIAPLRRDVGAYLTR